MNQQMETFLKNAKDFRRGKKAMNIHFTAETKRLAYLAEGGTNPCEQCKKKEECKLIMCLPYYIYFSHRWKNIQRGCHHAVER